MKHFVIALVLAFATAAASRAQADPGGAGNPSSPSAKRAVIYVMPNALANPGADNSQVVVASAHSGNEPQVAKIYQELQHRAECKGFSENMIKDRADYYLLLQHGGGKGNRWAVSDKQGDVIATGETLTLGNSVKDACVAIAKNRQAGGR